jgi:hypothetical protein
LGHSILATGVDACGVPPIAAGWPGEDPGQQGRGTEIAELVFPDRNLSYNPLVYTSRTESIYKKYLKSKAKKKDD